MQLIVNDDVKVSILPVSPEGSQHAFEQIALDNPDLRIEQRSNGEIIVMPPAGNESSNRNSEIIFQLVNWIKQDGRGKGFDSRTIFELPDGSKLGPDAAWVSKARLSAFAVPRRKKFLPVAPEFIIELRSETDRLPELHDEMLDWMRNGAELGWLIDADARRVWIYSTQGLAQTLNEPAVVFGQGPVAGFELVMEDIYIGLGF